MLGVTADALRGDEDALKFLAGAKPLHAAIAAAVKITNVNLREAIMQYKTELLSARAFPVDRQRWRSHYPLSLLPAGVSPPQSKGCSW